MNINIINTILRILNQQFLIPVQHLNLKYKFYQDLQMNYLEQMEMLFYVEKEFKINIEDKELNNYLNDLNEEYLECFKTDFHFSIEADDADYLSSIYFTFRMDVPRNEITIAFEGKSLAEIKEEIRKKVFNYEPSRFN